jgi:hypothetical protein
MVGLAKNIHDFEKRALRDWLIEKADGATMAVTLTQSLQKIQSFNARNSKQAYYSASTKGADNDNLHAEMNKHDLILATREVGQQDLKYVRFKLNRKLFGNKWMKHNRGLRTASIIEYNEQGYAHWHMAIRVDLKDWKYVANYINLAWQQTYLGGHKNTFELADDKFGWCNYLSKYGAKAYIDEINTTN